jgi:glycine/D-amino acid oxidase-like deaminating enzyme
MNQNSKTADVAIIGGGVIGLTVARALALRGVRDVLLLERNNLGLESSWAAAGMLAPQAEANRAHEFFHLTCRSRDMYPEFAAALLAILLASAPTARMAPVRVLIATTDGSLSTTPRPRTYTSVFAVPRSTAMSRPRNPSTPSVPWEGLDVGEEDR